MPINEGFFQSMQPGQNPVTAALGGYRGAIENTYLNPMLQQALSQQQQKTMQMQAQTPFAGRMAQNASIAQLPINSMINSLESGKMWAADPIMNEMMAGFIGNQLGMSVPMPLGAPTTPTQPMTPGAASYTNPQTGMAIAPPQQQTWMGNAGREVQKGWNALTQPSNTNMANVSQKPGLNGWTPSPQTVVPQAQQMNNLLPTIVKENKLTDLKDAGNGWFYAKKNGKTVKFKMPGV
jgi:hypothetical protein